MRTKVLLLFITLIAVTCFGASRMPVGELFSATDCGPCASAAAYIDANYPPIQPVSIIVRYEVDDASPFNDYDPTGMNGRVSTYFSGTYGVPNMHIDGTDYDAGPYSGWIDTLSSRAGTTAPLDIAFTNLTSDSVEITLTLEDGGYAGTYKLYAMITEDSIHYSAPNGQTMFHQIFRSMITNSHYGDNVTLSAAKSPVVKHYAIDINPDWNVSNCFIVVFVQNTSTLEILQGARVEVPAPEYYYTVDPHLQIKSSITSDTTATFSSTVYNQGSNNDNYDVYADLDIPSGWTATTYADGSPFSTHTTMSVLSLSSANISTTISSNGISGSGTVMFRVSSPSIPGQVDTVKFILNAGSHLLLVDDDTGASYEIWFQNVFSNIGVNFYNYDHSVSGAPSASFLEQFDVVVWMTGTDYGDVLSTTDASALEAFLDAGGKLYFSSPELGYYVYTGGGTSVQPFYENYLKAQYDGDNSSSRSITGTVGDPVGNGLSFSITGGDGANDQNYPDYISPRAGTGAVICLEYGTAGQHAGIRYDSGTYRIVYTGFGLEGISTEANRDTVMYRILNWLDPTLLDIRENKSIRPNAISISAHPNPFNSSCVITLSCHSRENGNPEGWVDVRIYDLRGNVVWKANLSDSKERIQRDAKHRWSSGTLVWQPDQSISSGIYLIKATMNDGRTTTKRVILIK